MVSDKGKYGEFEYENDRAFLKKAKGTYTDSRKLEILTQFYKTNQVYVGHEALSRKFYSSITVRDMLENEIRLTNEIARRHRKEPITPDESRQVFGECKSLLVRRVQELYASRIRGAEKRIKKFERENPNYEFNPGRLVQSDLFKQS